MLTLRNKGRVASQQSRSSFVPSFYKNLTPADLVSYSGADSNPAYTTRARQYYIRQLASRRLTPAPSRAMAPVNLRMKQASVGGTASYAQRSAKFRAFRKKGKAKYPRWFQILAKQDVPSHVAGQYTGQITSAINQKSFSTYWKHLSLIDIKNVLAQYTGTTSSGAPASNANKLYLSNIVRRHQWRNSEQNAACHVTCFVMYPRRDLPAYASVAAAQQQMPVISPPTSNSAVLGGYTLNPSMWTQAFTDEAKGTNMNAKIASTDTATTPYQAQILPQLFKIRRLKMKFPDGYKSQGILEPGQSLLFVGRRMKPEMQSFTKYGMDGSAAFPIDTVWEILRSTPLIVLQVKGTVSHDTTTKTLIGIGPSSLDYVQDFTYDVWNFVNSSGTISNPITNVAAVATAEQVEVVTASAGIEALA